MSPKILLVDDHHLFREGLRLMIAREMPDAAIVGEAECAAAARRQAQELRPDLIVMDIHLPDGDGLEVSRQILAELPSTRVIVLSADTSLAFVREALRAGVTGYLLKSNAPADLSRAIRTVLAGNLYLCNEAGKAALEDYRNSLTTEDGHPPALSNRELQVLRLIGDGLRAKEIADRLNVGVKTAETYRRRLLAKLGCGGTAELVRLAVRKGLLPP